MNNSEVRTFHRQVSGNPLYDEVLKRAPWEIEVEDFISTDSREIIARAVNTIKNDHRMLVLASCQGDRLCNTILINFDEETLNIDKPLDWRDDRLSRFRVYFQDIFETWNFFEVEVINDCPYSLCATYPDALYQLHRRKHYRIDTPNGTRAVFWRGDEICDGGYVKDISAAGMLICTGTREGKFTSDMELKDIAIALPQQSSSPPRGEAERPILPVINRGRIVRSFRDEKTDLICHGISFDDSDTTVEEQLNDFIKQQSETD